jgi:hypothetical protein
MWINYDLMIATLKGTVQINGFINMSAIQHVRMGKRDDLEDTENGFFIDNMYFCFDNYGKAQMAYNTIANIIKNPEHKHIYKLIDEGKQFGQIVVGL